MTGALWTALPGWSLRNTSTPWVESFEHYVLRVAESSGCTVASIRRSPRDGDDAESNARPGSLQRMERTIRLIEGLTGQNDLRCGTLWALASAIHLHGALAATRPRRWCPVCYVEQSAAEASEPLGWSIQLLQTCPEHGCALVDRCRICGATQVHRDSIVLRRQCYRCAAPLGWHVGSAHLAQSALERWIDAQILTILRYAADPRSQPLAPDAFHRACRVLQRIPERWARVPAAVRSRLRMKTRRTLPPPVLEVLLQIAAVQNCDALVLLTAPETLIEASLWPDAIDAQDAGLRKPSLPLLRLRAVLDHLLEEAPAVHLPPLATILPRLGIDPEGARRAEPERIARYQRRYVQQGASARLRRLDIAVARGLHSPSLTGSLVPTPTQRAQLRQGLERHLTAADARRVYATTIELGRLPAVG